MPYRINKLKNACTQSDGDRGYWTLTYTDKKGKKHRNCHTSKKNAEDQVKAIEAEAYVPRGVNVLRKFVHQVLTEGRRVTKGYINSLIRRAVAEAGYLGSGYIKEAIVYSRPEAYRELMQHMDGDVSGEIMPLSSVRNLIKPGHVVDVFIYARGYRGRRGELIDNVTVAIPMTRDEEMTDRGYFDLQPISLAPQ